MAVGKSRREIEGIVEEDPFSSTAGSQTFGSSSSEPANARTTFTNGLRSTNQPTAQATRPGRGLSVRVSYPHPSSVCHLNVIRWISRTDRAFSPTASWFVTRKLSAPKTLLASVQTCPDEL